MPPTPSARASQGAPTAWHAQELLLMREVMRLIGRSLAPGLVLREMLHLMSELLGLNRGRVVMADALPQASPTAAIRHAYGLTEEEFDGWTSAVRRHGRNALKVTQLQKFRQS